MSLEDLTYYLTKILPENFNDSAKLVEAYPLIYNINDKSGQEIALKEQIKGYKNLYSYLLESNVITDTTQQIDFNGFRLSKHLVKSLELNCPSAYSILLAEAIRKITLQECKFDDNQINNCMEIIKKTIELFGALGHYFGLRFSLQVGHYHFNQAANNKFPLYLVSNQTNKERAQYFYQLCANHFEQFSELVKEERNKNIFLNAYMGKEIQALFLEETQCKMEEFYNYLSKYFLKVEIIEINEKPKNNFSY